MYKGIKKEQYQAREVTAAIAALNYYLDGADLLTEHEIRQFLHAFLQATVCARKTCRSRNRRLDKDGSWTSDALERIGEAESAPAGTAEPEPSEAFNTLVADLGAIDEGVDAMPETEQ